MWKCTFKQKKEGRRWGLLCDWRTSIFAKDRLKLYCLLSRPRVLIVCSKFPDSRGLTADRCLVSSNFDIHINIKNIIHYFSAFTNKNLHKIKTLFRMQGLNIHRLPTSRYWDRDTSWIISFKDISQPNRPIVFSCFMDKYPNLGCKERF